jgi:hypothetical protein
MWDWYNRPGGRAAAPSLALVVAIIVAGVLVGALMMVLYTALAPLLFTPLPR